MRNTLWVFAHIWMYFGKSVSLQQKDTASKDAQSKAGFHLQTQKIWFLFFFCQSGPDLHDVGSAAAQFSFWSPYALSFLSVVQGFLFQQHRLKHREKCSISNKSVCEFCVWRRMQACDLVIDQSVFHKITKRWVEGGSPFSWLLFAISLFIYISKFSSTV